MQDPKTPKAPIYLANQRLATAEQELTRAMEAISLPAANADNELVGERLRLALEEVRLARAALEIVLEDSSLDL